jgi:hypothetical protein
MKSSPSREIIKLSTLIPLAVAIAAALIVQPSSATPLGANELVITENSPTSLTVTYNGSASGITIDPILTDQWAVVIPTEFNFFNGATFKEPENSATSNLVGSSAPSAGLLNVYSDIGGPGSYGNGATVDNVGLDVFNGLPINLTFNDQAQGVGGEKAPDTGSTLSLLVLALAGLFGASRVRPLRLA